MSRNLLHKNRLDDFKEWLQAQQIEVRAGKGHYQLFTFWWKDTWIGVYTRIFMPEHLSVDRRADPLVKRFIKEQNVENRKVAGRDSKESEKRLQLEGVRTDNRLESQLRSQQGSESAA